MKLNSVKGVRKLPMLPFIQFFIMAIMVKHIKPTIFIIYARSMLLKSLVSTLAAILYAAKDNDLRNNNMIPFKLVESKPASVIITIYITPTTDNIINNF